MPAVDTLKVEDWAGTTTPVALTAEIDSWEVISGVIVAASALVLQAESSSIPPAPKIKNVLFVIRFRKFMIVFSISLISSKIFL